MSATIVSPAPFEGAKIDKLVESCKKHSDQKLLEVLYMSILHMQELALEAGWGGIYNSGCCALTAFDELSVRGVTLDENESARAFYAAARDA